MKGLRGKAVEITQLIGRAQSDFVCLRGVRRR